MNKLQLREAKASLSAVVAAAERGRPTLITRHGRPSAMVVPIKHGRRLFPEKTASLADHLLSAPEPVRALRNRKPLRDAGL